jgi:hypothetical protein
MNTTVTEKQNPVIYNQVKQVLDELFEAHGKSDLKSFSNCFAQDENLVYMGTDFDEVWYDWQSFYHWMENEIGKWKGISINQKNTTITHSLDGKTAWYTQLIDNCPETKGDTLRIEGFRHSGVMENRNGKWLIVQSHLSVPYTSQNLD